jgi:CheY-like chemotaxis protein
VDVGTTATLWLPVASSPRPAQIERVPAAPATGGNQSLVIVAVDDDSLVLTGTVAMLEDLGHTVLPATSAQEGLERIRGEPRVALVVTDQMMPFMTGADLIRILQVERPGLPVVLASGFSEDPATLDPAVRRLAKPFGQADLAEAISRAIPAERA